VNIPRFVNSVTFVLGAALVVSSCASDASSAGTTVLRAVATPPTVSIAGAGITEGTGVLGSSKTAACDLDLRALEAAVEVQAAMTGDVPVTESALVTAGLITAESVLHDIGPGNVVVASAAGGCSA
jgi:hypothetical protein